MARNAQGKILKKDKTAKSGRPLRVAREAPSVKFQWTPSWIDDPIDQVWWTAHSEGEIVEVVVRRKGISRVSMAVFLVDMRGWGLKDGFIRQEIGLSRWKRAVQDRGDGVILTQTHLAKAQALVYGGLTWATQWGFRVSKETVDAVAFIPEPDFVPDLSSFGREGKPNLLMFSPDELQMRMPGVSLDEMIARGITF
jgi:hypothetical protein